MNVTSLRRRVPPRHEFSSVEEGSRLALEHWEQQDWRTPFDIVEQMVERFPEHQVAILAWAYDLYAALPTRTRYVLYQARHFDFDIRPGDKVLDIGSGHLPFPLATHLADITLTDHHYGRAGAEFRRVGGLPVFEVNVERTGFSDKEFDFVYCSHVLEHSEDPEAACRELMRIGKRGYIETPSRGKDVFLNSGRTSGHRWSVEQINGTIAFTEYGEEDLKGLGGDILMSMHCDPQTPREKAFSTLIYLNAPQVNLMAMWEDDFAFEVTRTATPSSKIPASAAAPAPRRPRFLQIHTFYDKYLADLYRRTPGLERQPYDRQSEALLDDAFSGVHMVAPYMKQRGYDGRLVVANASSQLTWAVENGLDPSSLSDPMLDILRAQIEAFDPDILYLSDPIQFDSRFVRALAKRPPMVMGWRAANIPAQVDWSEFDVMLSCLSGVRETALRLGARSAVHFTPGFPEWIAERVAGVEPDTDLLFTGQYNLHQYPRRNALLNLVAETAATGAFSTRLHVMRGDASPLPASIERFAGPPVFGLEMHRALRLGRIIFDARGEIGLLPGGDAAAHDLAGRQSANMRIFEVTGSGGFLLTERFDNLSDLFRDGEEIVTYGDEAEMLDKIRYYLAHPDERLAIAERGQRRCLKDHGMSKKTAEIDQIVRTFFSAQPEAQRLSGWAEA